LTLADFDDDGLDEIFAGSDSGIVVIDPVGHDILWYSQILPLYVSAVGYFDVDGDSFEDIVVGTVDNGYWLNVIYGPDYSALYTWDGYVNARINEIYNGIEPDTGNVLIFTQVSGGRGIYIINVDTWDYTYILRPAYNLGKTGSFLTEVITRRVTYDYYYRYFGEIQFYNSSLTSELFYRFRVFETYQSIANFGIGTVNGLFLVSNPASYISASYFENEGVIFEAFDENLGFVSEIVRPYSIPGLNRNRSHIFLRDDEFSMIDDLLLVNTYGNWETAIKAVYYDGHYLDNWGYLETNVPGFAQPCIGKVYSPQEDVFISKGRYKIYASRFYLTMVNTEEDEIIYPELFMALSVYPNPFNDQAKIALKLIESAVISVSMYDITGRNVSDIYNGFASKGINRFSVRGDFLSSGVYFVTASCDDYMLSSKVVLLK
jgi:hypothetical protein